jgi:hypothetical protein
MTYCGRVKNGILTVTNFGLKIRQVSEITKIVVSKSVKYYNFRLDDVLNSIQTPNTLLEFRIEFTDLICQAIQCKKVFKNVSIFESIAPMISIAGFETVFPNLKTIINNGI